MAGNDAGGLVRGASSPDGACRPRLADTVADLAIASGLARWDPGLLRHHPAQRRYAESGAEPMGGRAARAAAPQRHRGKRRRRVAVGRVGERAGAGDRLAEAGVGAPVAWLATPAGAAARRLGRIGPRV